MTAGPSSTDTADARAPFRALLRTSPPSPFGSGQSRAEGFDAFDHLNARSHLK